MRRRRPVVDPAFSAIAEAVDRAQRALLAAVPTARDPGVPVAEAVFACERELLTARSRVGEWSSSWGEGCDEAISQTLAEIEHLRLEAPSLGFEALNTRLGDVLAPLEIFVDAERALRNEAARRRPRE